jgi:MAF protein
MNRPNLLLASQSPRRHELLKLLGLPFEVTVADVSEEARAGETPPELVTRLSRAKATRPEWEPGRRQIVIGCDTVVALENGAGQPRILGKPADRREATAMLRDLRGRAHIVYSGVTTSLPGRGVETEMVATELRMRPYTDAEIAAYVASGDPLDKAGAYAIQHAGFDPVGEIDGCYASVMGLPLCHLTRLLQRVACSPAADVPAACQAHNTRRCRVYEEILHP